MLAATTNRCGMSLFSKRFRVCMAVVIDDCVISDPSSPVHR